MRPRDVQEIDQLGARDRGAEEVCWATRYRDIEIRPRPGSRPWLRSVARSAYLSLAGALARGPSGDVLFPIYFHGIYDDQVDAFRSLLSRFQHIGRFVTTDELVAAARGDRPIRGVEFHVSLDDGFDNNYRNAFPVLEDLGIHAAFFVPTAFVDAKDADVLAGWWMRGQVRHPTRFMTWSWLREMAAAGHEIGSHTRHHERLSEISVDRPRLRDEIEGSKRELENGLGRPCRYISWPYGTYADFDAVTRDAVRAAGYAACFSAVRGRITPDVGKLMDLPRHHLDPSWPWSHVRYFTDGGGE
jgi:peptidoglycan/xylan/chitin deacetylase (PgdA/CDA1 family)